LCHQFLCRTDESLSIFFVISFCVELITLDFIYRRWMSKIYNIYYHWFVLRKWISQTNITSKTNPEIWDMMRSPFQAKYINDSMFIKDLLRWHHFSVTLENSDIMLISCQLLANTVNIAFKDQNENVKIFDKMLKKDVDRDIFCEY
jgi:hypothetical protein